MLNRNECEKMLVWNDDEEKAKESIVIDISKDGSCHAVACGSENNFLSGIDYRTSYWRHCKIIPKKKTRPMTNEEMRGFVANTSGIEMRHRSWQLSEWTANSSIGSFRNPEDWQWRTISPTGEVGESQEFVVEIEE